MKTIQLGCQIMSKHTIDLSVTTYFNEEKSRSNRKTHTVSQITYISLICFVFCIITFQIKLYRVEVTINNYKQVHVDKRFKEFELLHNEVLAN